MKRANTGLVSIQPGFRRTVGIILVLILGSALLMSWARLAHAQASQEFSERRDTSGANTPAAGVNNAGDQSDICTPVLQASNTGNVLNEQGILQFLAPIFAPIFFDQYRNPLFVFGSPDDFVDSLDDLDVTGSSIDMEPTLGANCDQTIEEAAAADPAATDPFAGASSDGSLSSIADPTFWYYDDGTWVGSDGSSGTWWWNDDGTWSWANAAHIGSSPLVPIALLVLGVAGVGMLFRRSPRTTRANG